MPTGGSVCPQALADPLQQIVGAALGQGASKGGVAQPVPGTAARQTSGTRRTPADPGVALRAVQSLDLTPGGQSSCQPHA